MPARPPERLEGDGVVLRRPTPVDDAALTAAVAESLDHLRPWMAWADEAALTPERRRTHQEQVARGWSAGTDFAYVVLDPDETTVLGACGLHRRIGPGGIEIGYWVHAGHGGRGVGTAAAALATEAARALPDVDRVEIHCDETNARSAAIPRRLGYRLERVVDKEPQAPGETGREMNWVVDA